MGSKECSLINNEVPKRFAPYLKITAFIKNHFNVNKRIIHLGGSVVHIQHQSGSKLKILPN